MTSVDFGSKMAEAYVDRFYSQLVIRLKEKGNSHSRIKIAPSRLPQEKMRNSEMDFIRKE